MTPSWHPKLVRVPKSNESAVLCAFLMLFVQIAPENSLECGECLQDPEGLRRCVSSVSALCSINFSSFRSAQNSAGILVWALTPCLQTERGTQTPAVASSAPARRDLTIPCGSNTNFFAAPLS